MEITLEYVTQKAAEWAAAADKGQQMNERAMAEAM